MTATKRFGGWDHHATGVADCRGALVRLIRPRITGSMSMLIAQRKASTLRRWRFERLLRGTLRGWTIGLAVLVVWILAVRALWPAGGASIGPLAMIAAVAPLIWWPRWWAQPISDQRAIAWLDRRIQSHGVLMGLWQRDVAQGGSSAPTTGEDWQAHVRQGLEGDCLPAIRVQRPVLLRFAAAALAVLVALLVPQRLPAPPAPWHGGQLFADLAADIDAVAEDELAPPEEVERWRERMERLADPTASADPQALWEGADRLRADLERSRRQAGQQARALAAALQQAAQPPSHSDPGANSEALQRAMQQVAEHMAAMQAQAPGLLQNMDPGLRQQLSQALSRAAQGLTPQQRQALARMGIDPSTRTAQPMDQQAQRRAMRELRECLVGRCQSQGFGLPRYLAEGPNGRGPLHGDAPPAELTFNDESSEVDAADLQDLPPGAQVRPDGTVVLATQQREAEINDAAWRQAARARQQAFDPAAADARSARIAPRHRAAVQRYFDDVDPDRAAEGGSASSPPAAAQPPSDPIP